MTFVRQDVVEQIAEQVTELVEPEGPRERYLRLSAEPWPDPHNLEPWRCVWQPCKAARLNENAPLCRFHVMVAWQEGQKLIGGGMRTDEAIRSQSENGRVYFIRFGDRIKIGWSGNLPRRLKSLPHDEIIGSVPGTLQDEKRWHIVFADHRSVGEWFHDTPELRAAIKSVVDAQ